MTANDQTTRARGADRREFVRSGLRYGGAVALFGLVAGSVWQARANGCRRPSLCGACPVFGGCDLPKAQAFRAKEDGP